MKSLCIKGDELLKINKAVEVLREERFRDIADNIPILAWTANANGWIYWYNKQWYEYTGTTLEEMHGWGWQTVITRTMLIQLQKNGLKRLKKETHTITYSHLKAKMDNIDGS